jgi:hypothetical protein
MRLFDFIGALAAIFPYHRSQAEIEGRRRLGGVSEGRSPKNCLMCSNHCPINHLKCDQGRGRNGLKRQSREKRRIQASKGLASHRERGRGCGRIRYFCR